MGFNPLPYLDDIAYPLMATYRPDGKIVGHRPGWANQQNEENTDSDFRAGYSYFPRVNKSYSFMEKYKLGKKGLISVALAGSMLFGGSVSAENLYGLSSRAEEKLNALTALAKKEGIDFKVTEGYRSQARQDLLYSQGRTAPGKKVTFTKRSKHTSRNAFDIAVMKEGKITWEPKDYFRIGQLGEAVGLTWGGQWKTRDLVHFEIPDTTKPNPKITIQTVEHDKAFSKEVSKVMKKHRQAAKPTAGLVNKVLHNNKTSSKMGTASYKAVNFIRKLIKR